MATVAARPSVSVFDRFGLTLCLAIILHAIFILGVTFAPEDLMESRYETMEIILVQQSEPKPPTEAEFLAQANLEGGGDSDEQVSPSTPVPAPFPAQKAAETAPPPVEQTPPEPQVTPAPEETTVEAVPESEPAKVEEVLVAESEIVEDEVPLPVEDAKPKESPPEPVETKAEEKTEDLVKKAPPKPPAKLAEKRPSAAALLTNSFKIASLSAEIRRKMESKAKRPRRKFVSASTKEFRFASYMEAWRSKVERVGNLNYPDEARRKKLSGHLILDVALNPDGSINEITVRKPSGYKILDDAAVRIVELAAPYAPFPDSFREDTDILHITRTWQFLNNKGFR